jgi:hypothetical protein
VGVGVEQPRLQVQPARECPQRHLVQQLGAARVHAVERAAARAPLPPPASRPALVGVSVRVRVRGRGRGRGRRRVGVGV